MRAKVSNNWIRSCSEEIPGFDESTPYEGRWFTEVTGTPFMAIARGKPWPKLTPFSTFSPSGSKSRMTLPSQPSIPMESGSQVCQMSMARKCERGEFSNPIP